jgi:DNA-binding transcriptional LysR family regulator
MLPDLTSLELLRLTCDLGSLSKAAARMHITVSAVSRRIALLEHHFGLPLLKRLPGGGVAPTPAGTVASAGISRLMRELERVHSEVADYARGVRGYVRLDVNTTAMGRGFPAQLARFQAAHQDIKMDLREMRSADIVTAIREGHSDVGIIMEGVDVEGLRLLPYVKEQLKVVLPTGHPFQQDPARFAALLDSSFVVLDTNAAQTDFMRRTADGLGRPLKISAKVQSFEAICRMVEAGFGVALLYESALLTYMQRLAIRTVALDEVWAHRQMHLCMRAGDLNSAVSALLGYLQSEAAGQIDDKAGT